MSWLYLDDAGYLSPLKTCRLLEHDVPDTSTLIDEDSVKARYFHTEPSNARPNATLLHPLNFCARD